MSISSTPNLKSVVLAWVGVGDLVRDSLLQCLRVSVPLMSVCTPSGAPAGFRELGRGWKAQASSGRGRVPPRPALCLDVRKNPTAVRRTVPGALRDQDESCWPFREAGGTQHLSTAPGFVFRVLAPVAWGQDGLLRL